VQFWQDLQSVHGFRRYDNIAPNAKCQRALVLALCLVETVIHSPLCPVWPLCQGLEARDTWLQTVDTDLAPLNIGLTTVYHRAQNRQA